MAKQKQSITMEADDFKAMVQSTYGFGGDADNVEIRAENENGESIDTFAVHLLFERDVVAKKRGGRRKKDTSDSSKAVDPSKVSKVSKASK